jgi:hypothetical protein
LEELAMKAVSHSLVKCMNGQHNPLVTSHLEENCFKLYPKQKECMEKRQAKSQSKGKAKKVPAFKTQLSLSSAWHVCIMKAAMTRELNPNTAYLESCSSHHMIVNCDAFTTYSTNSKFKIKLADGKSTTSPGKVFGYIKTETGNTLKLEFLHVPKLVGNLISLVCFMQKGCHGTNGGVHLKPCL